MAVRPIFSPPVPYGTRFSTISTLTQTVCTGLDAVPSVGVVYNLSYRILVFWSDPTFLPRGHTEWSFGLCFRILCPMAHVSRPFTFRHEPFAPGWMWFHVWVPCITFSTEFGCFGPIPHFFQGVIPNGHSVGNIP
jgi:hypothetical protein